MNRRPGKLGVIEEGAYADILLVDGNPLEDISMIGGNAKLFDAPDRKAGDIKTMPFIIAGLRLAIGRAILGIVVAEFFGGSSEGVGVIMVDAAGKFQVDVVFAGLIIFMSLSLVMTAIVKVLENRLSRWRPQIVKTF